MIGQVLNREVVQAQLPRLADTLAQLEDGKEAVPNELGHLSKADLERARKALLGKADKPVPAEPPEAGDRRAVIAPVDDFAFIPRDAITSIVQSAIEEAIRTQTPGDIVQAAPGGSGRRGDENVPPVTDEYVGGPLDERRDADGSRRLGGAFEIPSDPRWASCKIAEGIRFFRGKQPFVDRPPARTIGGRTRIFLVGDWGTGIPRAQRVAETMRIHIEQAMAEKDLEVHVVHLGDVYYSGFGYEYTRRFLPYWPVYPDEAAQVGSWSLVGNHDMYSGGQGYWKQLLTDARFAGHDGCSYFSFENDDWRILALDTSWKDGDLAGRQPEWLEQKLAGPGKTIVLSHHQLFSVFSDAPAGLHETTLEMLAKHPVHAWFWGHEHRCMTFTPFANVQYGRCIGHGGVPVYQFHNPNDTPPYPGQYEYCDVIKGSLSPEPWQVMGFAILDLDGGQASVEYRNEFDYPHLSEQLT